MAGLKNTSSDNHTLNSQTQHHAKNLLCKLLPPSAASPTPMKTMRFAPELIKGPTNNGHTKRAPAALRVCNTSLDRHPREAAIDSAATGHFINDKHQGANHQPVLAAEAVDVECANATSMLSTSTDIPDIQKLNRFQDASKCNEFKDMSASPVSVRQSDKEANLAVLFQDRQAKAFDPVGVDLTIPQENVIMEGKLKPGDGLCMTPLHDNVQDQKHPQFKNIGSPMNEHHLH